MSRFHSLTISEKTSLTPDAITLAFEIPAKLQQDFAYKAGQYLTLKAMIDGNEVRRAYSICEAPGGSILRVGIKRVEGGLFSNFACDQVQVGDAMEVMLPEGQFVWEAGTHQGDVLAVAAGSGITPILSIITSALAQNDQFKIALVYGNKSQNDSMFYQDLKALQADHPDRFHFIEVYSRTKEENALFGRIGKPIINYMLKSRLADLDLQHHYLCGPEAMIQEVTATLKEAGVASDRIHFELFTSSSDSQEVIDVPAGKTAVTMMLDDEESRFTMDASTSVLDAALNEGLDAPYSCQGGICSTCIARVTEGKVTMRKNQILTDAELEEGLVLACQAHPESAVLKIDFDDV